MGFICSYRKKKMNITAKNINNSSKTFDTCENPQSRRVSIICNKFARALIEDSFCKNNSEVSFDGNPNEICEAILKLNKFLKKDEVLIAKTKCKNYSPERNAKDIEVFITHKIVRYGFGIKDQEFYRLLSSAGNELADMKVYCTTREGLKYGTKIDEPITNGYLYIADMRTKGGVSDNAQKTKREYSGLGTTLVKMAVKRSIEKGLEGRIRLEAAWNSHGFHHKNGFKVSEDSTIVSAEKIEREIEELIEKADRGGKIPDTRNIGSINMYLPKEKIKSLLDKGEAIELL